MESYSERSEESDIFTYQIVLFSVHNGENKFNILTLNLT